MRILTIESEPFHALQYHVGPTAGPVQAVLPFRRARVEGLPNDLDTIVATSDLQGVVLNRPLGEALASELTLLRQRGELGPKGRTAVILAGDLYPGADEGDVRGVWYAFAEEYRWVAGVAGNHDAFGNGMDRAGVHLLDGETVDLDRLTIGGLSGICGTRGACVRDPIDFAGRLARLAQQGVDVLISHDGPNVAETSLPGWPCVREALEASRPALLIRGHDAWTTPLAMLANGTQVLNVEGRVVVLQR